MVAATAVVGVHPSELSRWLNGYQADLRAEHAAMPELMCVPTQCRDVRTRGEPTASVRGSPG